MKDCIFCKIIKGEIPSYTIYEDELVKVFLDVNPLTNGHTLIIPKKHYKNLFEADEEILKHSLKLVKEKFYPLFTSKLKCSGLSITQNNGHGQEVKHLHIHLIPRYENDLVNDVYNKELLKPVEEIFELLNNN